MTTVEYITLPGDRWDLICWRAYGTTGEITLDDGSKVNAIGHIIRANPDLTINSILTAGILLQIPVVPFAGADTDKSLLPPWK